MATVVFRSYSSKHTSTLNDSQFPYIMQIPSYIGTSFLLSPGKKTNRQSVSAVTIRLWETKQKALQAGRPLLGLAVGNTAQVRLASGSSRGAFLFQREWLLWACPLFSLPPIWPVSYLGSVQTGSDWMLSLPSTSIAIIPDVWFSHMFVHWCCFCSL